LAIDEHLVEGAGLLQHLVEAGGVRVGQLQTDLGVVGDRGGVRVALVLDEDGVVQEPLPLLVAQLRGSSSIWPTTSSPTCPGR
jgi:hypothetical protein